MYNTALLNGVGLAKRASRLGVPGFRAARLGGPAQSLSAAAAAATARRALAEVPAYAEFVAGHGGSPRGGSPAGWLAGLPISDKRNYIDAYPLAALCRHGVVPARRVELDESSGSSGRPYTWVRSERELREVHRTMALPARHVLNGQAGWVVTLNGFSMGAWATGINVSRALGRLGGGPFGAACR
jgi:phenylacetate-CoA ligase